MQATLRRRLRQVAIVAIFIVGVFATAATQPARTTVDITPARATLQLDAGQPAVLTRFVVSLDAEATAGEGNNHVALHVDEVRSAGASGSAADLGQPRFIVTTATPGSLPMSGTPMPDEAPRPTTWQVEAQPGAEVGLPIDCGVGPCQRAFWLIAELANPDAMGVEVDWHLDGRLTFYGSAWPSGAGARIEIDPSIAIAGPVPALVASSEPEPLILGPSQPAAAREVELTLGAAAVPDDGSRVATIAVDLVRHDGPRGTSGIPPVVQLYPIDGPNAGEPGDGPLPTPSAADLDPFAGCLPGAECTRRFLATFAWTGETDEDETYEWSVKVRRVDLVRAWSTPADLSATVTRRFDVDPQSESRKVHLEGDVIAAPFDRAPQVQLALTTSTTSSDSLTRLLPVPALLRYRATVISSDPSADDPNLGTVILPTGHFEGDARRIDPNFDGPEQFVVANPMAGCRLGESCDYLTIETVAHGVAGSTPRVPINVHWTLDLTVYSYTDVPITLTTEDDSPPGP